LKILLKTMTPSQVCHVFVVVVAVLCTQLSAWRAKGAGAAPLAQNSTSVTPKNLADIQKVVAAVGAHGLVEIQAATGTGAADLSASGIAAPPDKYAMIVDTMIAKRVGHRGLADFIIEHRWSFACSLISALARTHTGLASIQHNRWAYDKGDPLSHGSSVVLARRTVAASFLKEIIIKNEHPVMPYEQKSRAVRAFRAIQNSRCEGDLADFAREFLNKLELIIKAGRISREGAFPREAAKGKVYCGTGQMYRLGSNGQSVPHTHSTATCSKCLDEKRVCGGDCGLDAVSGQCVQAEEQVKADFAVMEKEWAEEQVAENQVVEKQVANDPQNELGECTEEKWAEVDNKAAEGEQVCYNPSAADPLQMLAEACSQRAFSYKPSAAEAVHCSQPWKSVEDRAVQALAIIDRCCTSADKCCTSVDDPVDRWECCTSVDDHCTSVDEGCTSVDLLVDDPLQVECCTKCCTPEDGATEVCYMPSAVDISLPLKKKTVLKRVLEEDADKKRKRDLYNLYHGQEDAGGKSKEAKRK